MYIIKYKNIGKFQQPIWKISGIFQIFPVFNLSKTADKFRKNQKYPFFPNFVIKSFLENFKLPTLDIAF